jgi:BMFP domain-containing protein YqiC
MPWLATLLSQAPTADQIELLTQQIEFLQDANSRMATSFSQFVTLINAVVVVVGVFLGILGFRTRQEIKQSLDEMVRAEVNKQIASTVQAQVEDLDRIVRREALVGQTQVDYLLPTATANDLTAEYQLLKARGFQMAWLPYDPDRRLAASHVLVLDLINPNLSEERQEALITEVGRKISHLSPQPPVLVIYVRGRRQAVDAFPKEMVYIPANSRGTMIGAVTDAATLMSIQGTKESVTGLMLIIELKPALNIKPPSGFWKRYAMEGTYNRWSSLLYAPLS